MLPGEGSSSAGDISGLTSVTTIQCSESTLTGPTIIITLRNNPEVDVDRDQSTTPSPPLLPANLEGGSPSPYITSARGSKSPDGPNHAPLEGPTPATPFDANIPDRSSNDPTTIHDLVSNEDPSTPLLLVEDQPGSKRK